MKMMNRLACCWLLVSLAALPVFGQEANLEGLAWELKPFDQISLDNGTEKKVYRIEPIRISEEDFKAMTVQEEEFIGQIGLPPLKALAARGRKSKYHVVLLSDGLKYELFGETLKEIKYYEDLLIEGARSEIDKKRYDGAMPYLTALVDRLGPQFNSWPGALETRIMFHRDEAMSQSVKIQFLPAFENLRQEKTLRDELEKTGRKMDRGNDAGPTWEFRLADVADRWLNRLVSSNQREESRRTIARLEAYHPPIREKVTNKWRRDIQKRAEELTSKAKQAESEGNLIQANQFHEWAMETCPDSPVSRPAIEEFYQKHGVLKVAVDSVPSFRGGFSEWNAGDMRCAELIHLPIAELVPGKQANSPPDTLRSDIISAVNRSRNNVEADLVLKEGLVWPTDNKPVTITDIQRLLADSVRPESPFYHPIFSRLVTAFEPKANSTLTVSFFRAQYLPERWLQIPFVRQTHDVGEDEFAAIARTGLGPFLWGRSSQNRVDFRANPKYIHQGEPKIKILTELANTSSAQRLRMLEKGLCDLDAYVPPRHYEAAKNMPGVKLVRLSKPTVHVLQFNMNRAEIRNPTLRRTISLAIDREAILKSLSVTLDKENGLINCPLPRNALGYNNNLNPNIHDTKLAKLFVFSLSKSFKSIPPLRLFHSGNEASREACRQIVKSLNEVGLKVTLIDPEEGGGQDPFDADLRYQTFTVNDSAYDLVTLLTRDNPSLSRNAEPFVRDRILSLINASTASDAANALPAVCEVLHEHMSIIPLWQLHDHFAVSDRVSGRKEGAPKTIYEGVGKWTVSPSFPEPFWSP